MRRDNILILLRSAVLIIISAISLVAGAQNNPFKIDDRVYKYYNKAISRLKVSGHNYYIDTMLNEAVRLNDKKGICIATSLKARHTLLGNDYEPVKRELDELRRVSRLYNYTQYYYYATQLEVVWLLNHGRSIIALDLVKKMKNEAFAEKNGYGIYNSLRCTGDIFFNRSCYSEAYRNYKAALDHMLENLPDQNPADIYLQVSLALKVAARNDESKLREALEYAKKSEEKSVTITNKLKAQEMQCVLYYLLGRKDLFVEKSDALFEQYKKYKTVTNSAQYYSICMYRAMMNGDYAEARKYTKRVYEVDGLVYMADIAAKQGDYQEAYQYHLLASVKRDSIQNALSLSDMTEFNAQLENERLRQEFVELELKNSNLQLAQARQEMEMDRIRLNNQKLVIQNKDLELVKAKANAENMRMQTEKDNLEHARAKAEFEQKQMRSHIHIIMLCCLAAILLVVVGASLAAFYRRRKQVLLTKKQNELLREANQRAESALAEAVEARKRAEEANKMKIRFIQNMSHEVRTPLNSIVGFSQMLTDNEVEISAEERREFSRLIEQNSQLLTSLVNDILSISDMESGNYKLSYIDVPCNVLGLNAINMVEHMKPAGVELTYTSEVDDNFVIHTDHNRVEQVLINLLTNAEKYTSKGKIWLHCSLSENPGMITFSVTDTGTGVPAEEAEAIFERFRKLDTFKQGCGLGLNICRIIATNMGGNVTLDTSYTGGARFVFTLPITHNEDTTES